MQPAVESTLPRDAPRRKIATSTFLRLSSDVRAENSSGPGVVLEAEALQTAGAGGVADGAACKGILPDAPADFEAQAAVWDICL